MRTADIQFGTVPPGVQGNSMTLQCNLILLPPGTALPLPQYIPRYGILNKPSLSRGDIANHGVHGAHGNHVATLSGVAFQPLGSVPSPFVSGREGLSLFGPSRLNCMADHWSRAARAWRGGKVGLSKFRGYSTLQPIMVDGTSWEASDFPGVLDASMIDPLQHGWMAAVQGWVWVRQHDPSCCIRYQTWEESAVVHVAI